MHTYLHARLPRTQRTTCNALGRKDAAIRLHIQFRELVSLPAYIRKCGILYIHYGIMSEHAYQKICMFAHLYQQPEVHKRGRCKLFHALLAMRAGIIDRPKLMRIM